MKFSQRLLAPEFWIGVFTLLAAVGLACVAISLATHEPVFFDIGLWLFAPLLVTGALLTLVVVPILIVLNRKHRKK